MFYHSTSIFTRCSVFRGFRLVESQPHDGLAIRSMPRRRVLRGIRCTINPMSNSGRIVVGVATVILSYQMLLAPVVCLADNGDFVKVIGRFDLYARVYRTYQFCDVTYDFHPERHWVSGFYSTETLLVLPALFLNTLFSKGGSFDIRYIGIVHGALFLAALWLFAGLLDGCRRAVRVGLHLLLLIFYCDVMYVSGMNSFGCGYFGTTRKSSSFSCLVG
jgi:hypothetical protein